MKKTTFWTVALTLLFVIAAVFFLLFSFHRLKTSDASYSVVDQSGEIGIFAEELPSVLENDFQYRKTWGYHQQKLLEVDGNNFYQYTTGQISYSEYISAEEAAQIAHEAFEEAYPDKDWAGDFVIFLMPTQDIGYFSEKDTGSMVSYVWCVVKATKDIQHTTLEIQVATPLTVPTAMVNPISGKVVAVTCPNQDWLKSLGYNTPWISLHDFLYYTNEETWIRIGTRYIRETGLNGDEIVVRADPDADISYGLNGTVYIPFVVGTGENSFKIQITIDLYTKECVGCVLHENMKMPETE